MTQKLQLINYIRKNGHNVIINDKKCREVIGLSFIVYDFYYILADDAEKYVSLKIKRYKKEINKVIKILNNDIHSRQAVISFNLKAKKPNCVVSMQFFVRNKKLSCIINSRSLDIEKYFYQDIEIAMRISDIIRLKLKHKIDRFHTLKLNCGSLHYYI